MAKTINTGRSSGGRATVQSTRGVVSSGHYLATGVGADLLRRGGNAADAAAGMAFALCLTQPHLVGIAGEGPVMVRPADGPVQVISGQGTTPAAATLAHYLSLGIDRIPGDGWLGAVVPATVGTQIELLARFGTMRLTDVLAPAIELARAGFAPGDYLSGAIADHADRFADQWPGSAELFMPDGRPPAPDEPLANPDWADAMQRLVDAEARFPRDRAAGLEAARVAFYEDLAETFCDFARTTPVLDASGRAHTALLTTDDVANWRAAVERPVACDYHGWTVCKCPTWTQGPAQCIALNLLAGFDLPAMGHNSPQYIHTVVEAMKLAYADREFNFADPAAADVPLGRLLSADYADQRRALIDPAAASARLRPGVWPAAASVGPDGIEATSVLDVERAFGRAIGDAQAGEASGPEAGPSTSSGPEHGDTTKLDVIDAAGNAVSATVSGGWLMSSPVVPGLGFPLGTRGQMFSLAEGHPNVIAPGKRPRATLTPTIAVRTADDPRGGPLPVGTVLTFGSPGGDSQDQWGLQFFLNVVHFGMSPQHATEAATFWSEHWPNSFYPRAATPRSLWIEDRVDRATRDALADLGHRITAAKPWSGGNTLATLLNPATGMRSAAASPRLEPAAAMGL